MPLKDLVPLNTTVEVLVKPHYGKIGRVAGHTIVDLAPLNIVHIPHDQGAHKLDLPGDQLEAAPYDAVLWAKNCWTPPA